MISSRFQIRPQTTSLLSRTSRLLFWYVELGFDLVGWFISRLVDWLAKTASTWNSPAILKTRKVRFSETSEHLIFVRCRKPECDHILNHTRSRRPNTYVNQIFATKKINVNEIGGWLESKLERGANPLDSDVKTVDPWKLFSLFQCGDMTLKNALGQSEKSSL
jgi:hypothetical protein